MRKAKINGAAAKAEPVKGADLSVSRETAIMNRVMQVVMIKAESMCQSVRELTDEVLLPVVVLARVLPDHEAAAKGSNIGDILVSSVPVVRPEDIGVILQNAVNAINRQTGAEPDEKLGNEGDALAAMKEAIKPESPGDAR